MEQFDPPGFLTDLNAAQCAQWSDWISAQFDAVAAGEPDRYDFDAPRPRFFNPLTQPPAADAVEKDIRWNAFPRIVQINAASDDERWRTADASRDTQDEYCEWSVTRDPQTRKITRVTFTSEGPEYWQFLAAVNFPLVVQLYQQHVDPRVKDQDLRGSDGSYNPRNRWNASTSLGAMHLIQANNTLGAEIELAAGASNVRVRNGTVLAGEAELIACGKYGAAQRHSDPHIGAEVNALARADAAITLANPVGLCIDGLSVAGWETPDGSDPLPYWKVTRGTAQKALRAVYEVPPDKGFVVGDIKINGLPIDYGAQIADAITIKLTGLATRLGQVHEPALQGCKKLHHAPGAGLAAPGVADLLNLANRASRR